MYGATLPATWHPALSHVDLEPYCSPIEDQGEIGSCTANASTSAMEFLFKKGGLSVPQLSRLFVYFASRVFVEHSPPFEDSGAQIRDVMKALATYGVCLESTWPYRAGDYSLQPSPAAIGEATHHRILTYYRIPNLPLIKHCLADGFPIVGGFSVPENAMGPQCAKTGVVIYPEPGESFVGGHAVLFVGYDDARGVVKFANSWSTGWGDRGFGYLPYAFFFTGLANDFWTIRREEM